MRRTVLIVALLSTSLACYVDYPCNCYLNGKVTTYTIHEKNSNTAQAACDSYVAGDTCEIVEKK